MNSMDIGQFIGPVVYLILHTSFSRQSEVDRRLLPFNGGSGTHARTGPALAAFPMPERRRSFYAVELSSRWHTDSCLSTFENMWRRHVSSYTH